MYCPRRQILSFTLPLPFAFVFDLQIISAVAS